MLRTFACGLIAALAGFSFIGAGRADDAPTWKAGAASVVITPDKLMWMSGYGSRTHPAEGKLTELYAKALVLEDPQGQRAVLVTMDLVGIDRATAKRVCTELNRQFGLHRDQIALNVSHTHSGPAVGENLRGMFFLDAADTSVVEEYTASLERKLVGVVGQAIAKLAPARLSRGTGFAEFAVNRRTNVQLDVPRLRELGQLKGPSDHDVPVLCVRDPAGKLVAVAFGYACHATVLGLYEWCGDYPGYAQAQLEEDHPGAVALFWTGCGADQNPLPRRTIEHAQRYGGRLARAVDEVLNTAMTPIEGALATEYAEIPLAFGKLPTREQLELDAKSTNKYIAARAHRYLTNLDAGHPLEPTYPYPVQVWRLGPDLLWTFLGGEVVVDYSLRLKRELGQSTTWVAGYSNDVMAYIPSLRVLNEGGYEGATAMVYYDQPTAWSEQVEQSVVEQVKDQVRAVKKAENGKRKTETR